MRFITTRVKSNVDHLLGGIQPQLQVSGFRSEVAEKCPLLGYYKAINGNF